MMHTRRRYTVADVTPTCRHCHAWRLTQQAGVWIGGYPASPVCPGEGALPLVVGGPPAHTAVDGPEALALLLTEHAWCMCNGFRLPTPGGPLLFLNDSTSADGAQEYAVIREADRVQIESITFGWCTTAQALAHILALVHGSLCTQMGTVDNRIDTPAEHGTCAHCA